MAMIGVDNSSLSLEVNLKPSRLAWYKGCQSPMGTRRHWGV